jgi:hypothetical protein
MLNGLNLQGYGNNIFAMEDKLRAFHGKIYCKAARTNENRKLGAFPIFMYFVHEIDKRTCYWNSI